MGVTRQLPSRWASRDSYTYPDSASGTDVVTHAYNAQGERIWTKDQAGNVIETDFDTSGRQTARRATTVDADFDDEVLRIETTYDALGRRELVTQYDAARSGTVLDEVKFTYDGWGNVTTFEQDVNSAVGAMSSVDDYEIAYTWSSATSGRNTLRRTSMTLPSGNVIAYNYRSTGGLYDDAVSRVTDLTDGAVTVEAWSYNGLVQVVGVDYPEPGIMSHRFGSTSGTYADLDVFDPMVTDRWTKDLSTDVDFYRVALTWDRASNITSADDQVHAGFDVKYTIDDVDRLTRAQEGTLGGGSIFPSGLDGVPIA